MIDQKNQKIENFDLLDLEAQKELDNILGHFCYLRILKRSFLALVAATGESQYVQSYLEVGEI